LPGFRTNGGPAQLRDAAEQRKKSANTLASWSIRAPRRRWVRRLYLILVGLIGFVLYRAPYLLAFLDNTLKADDITKTLGLTTRNDPRWRRRRG
jgi:hypothetical protein